MSQIMLPLPPILTAPVVPIATNQIQLIPGILTLGTKEVTINVPGIFATDQISIQPNVALPAGLSIGCWRVSSANTVVVQFVTAIALGLNLGSNSYAATITVLK